MKRIIRDGGRSADRRDPDAATKKGFAQAEKAWGGPMPSITGQTYDAVMEKFDKIKKELFGGETSEAATA